MLTLFAGMNDESESDNMMLIVLRCYVVALRRRISVRRSLHFYLSYLGGQILVGTFGDTCATYFRYFCNGQKNSVDKPFVRGVGCHYFNPFHSFTLLSDIRDNDIQRICQRISVRTFFHNDEYSIVARYGSQYFG